MKVSFGVQRCRERTVAKPIVSPPDILVSGSAQALQSPLLRRVETDGATFLAPSVSFHGSLGRELAGGLKPC